MRLSFKTVRLAADIICFSILYLGLSAAYGTPISISPHPCKVIDFPTNFQDPSLTPLFAGKNSRVATCSGVCWFHNNEYLAAVSLASSSLQIYSFDPTSLSFTPIQFASQAAGAQLAYPVSLSVLEDWQLLAVTNSKNGLITLYKIDPLSHQIDPHPIFSFRPSTDVVIHGIRFFSEGKNLAVLSIDHRGRISIFRLEIDRDGKPVFSCTQSIETRFGPLKPKGIDFSADGRFAAICYSVNAGGQPKELPGLLVIYRFDPLRGMIDPIPVSRKKCDFAFSVPEDIVFYPDSSCLFVTDQDNQTVTVHEFNSEKGTIGTTLFTLKNPEAQMKFPHGLSISSDGKYLAITHLANSTITIHSIEQE